MDRKRLLFGIAAVVVPFVVQAVWIVLANEIGPRMPGYGNVLSQRVSTSVGIVFLAIALRGWAIPAAVIYLPAMFYCLLGFTLVFGCGFYGSCL